jgi:hypothetical protein
MQRLPGEPFWNQQTNLAIQMLDESSSVCVCYWP